MSKEESPQGGWAGSAGREAAAWNGWGRASPVGSSLGSKGGANSRPERLTSLQVFIASAHVRERMHRQRGPAGVQSQACWSHAPGTQQS